ncbi:MAG TPA: hypothetical protein DIT48_01740, partial [Actinobacteria bacterium]|nr:hypothetical protein [Actinomycetota bacterium]
MNLTDIADLCRQRLQLTSAARERALPTSRRSIRASANAIRAVHRGEWDLAHRLMDESRAALDEGEAATRAEHP